MLSKMFCNKLSSRGELIYVKLKSFDSQFAEKIKFGSVELIDGCQRKNGNLLF